MLIKRRKLGPSKAPSKKNNEGIIQLSQSAQALQEEINKAKHEAQGIKEEAKRILSGAREELKKAQEQADEIIKQAEIDAIEIEKKVYEESKAAFNEEIMDLREETKFLFADILDIKREALMQVHKDIIKVALDLAEKIIRYQANIDPEILKTQVIEAIKKASSSSERIQVFVNPQDLSKLEENIESIEKLFPAGITITALTNESVDPGSCTIETKSGQLDARFSTQLMTLTKLCEHLEVAEPIINIENEEIEIKESELNITPFEELIKNKEIEETLKIPEIIENHEHNLKEPNETISKREEELLEEGFTSDETLMKELLNDNFKDLNTEDIIQGDNYFENSLEIIEENSIPEIRETVEQKEEIIPETAPDVIEEITSEILEQDEITETEDLPLELEYEESKVITDEISEIENPPFKLEYEEDDELEEEEENLDTKSILKPKKQINNDFNSLADEVEQNPEWKDLLD